MNMSDAYIPYGAWWSTPFCKWQGSFAELEPIPFAAACAERALKERGVDAAVIDELVLGTTVPSKHSFYGAPWLAGLAGLESVTGPTLSQACATSARCVAHAAHDVVTGAAKAALVVTADRTSNGPHVVYPQPSAPGGTAAHENWVMDNFGHDPFAKNAMLDTAERVAKDLGITREEQDQVALLRYEQYQRALAEERAFQKRYMLDEVAVTDARGKVKHTVTGDEGIFPTTADALAKLKPVQRDGGTVTFGSQTFPADGNAGLLVTNRDTARSLATDNSVEVQLLGVAQARVNKGEMPRANGPAVREALTRAGVGLDKIKAITTHTPFAVNDVALARELEIELESMNRYGCSLVWGHPQAPTGLRALLELFEELALLGGGHGLFTGCAAGDSAMALVVKVNVA